MTSAPDLGRLDAEIRAAGLIINGLNGGPVEDGYEVMTADGSGNVIDLPPEARAILDAHDPTVASRTAAFGTQEDAELLQLVRDRAAEDPAFAALVDLTLGKGTT